MNEPYIRQAWKSSFNNSQTDNENGFLFLLHE